MSKLEGRPRLIEKEVNKKFTEKPNPVMKRMELSSSDQQTTARCTARGTTGVEVARVDVRTSVDDVVGER